MRVMRRGVLAGCGLLRSCASCVSVCEDREVGWVASMVSGRRSSSGVGGRRDSSYSGLGGVTRLCI